VALLHKGEKVDWFSGSTEQCITDVIKDFSKVGYQCHIINWVKITKTEYDSIS